MVGGDPDAREAGGVVQGLQHARERDRAAVRVGDDAVVAERSFAVHLGDDERNPLFEAVRGRLVDRNRAAADGVGHELATCFCADGEQAKVEVAGGERLSSRLLDD